MAYFSKIRIKKPRRHLFNLSHEHLTTFNMGELIPIYWEETLPGDKFSVGVESFLRFMPLISPVMHRINLRFYAFFVPNRLFGQDNWENFITGGQDGTAYSDMRFSITADDTGDDVKLNRILKYLGYFETSGSTGLSHSFPTGISMFPLFSYYLIWNEFFRDQNLIDPITFGSVISSGYGYSCRFPSGLPLLANGGVMRKCWEKDYFTSALPWLQRGNPADLPISFGTSSVNTIIQDKQYQGALEFGVGEGETMPTGANQVYNMPNSDGETSRLTADGNTDPQSYLQPRNLSDFLSAETTLDEIEASFTINDLRRAEALQRWMEKSARGGSRYIEQIRSFFGVVSSDSRLQRPEFLGALSSPVSISEVLQHSQTTSDGTPLGEMGGHGISASGNWIFRNRFFEEHGTIMILACVQPRTSYFGNLIDRRFYKPDRFHYYWPDFARIGEQPLYKFELFTKSRKDLSEPDVFGYQERYSEYKQRLSRISGDFDSSMDFWHLGRSFDASVSLNNNFVTCSPSSRIFAVEDESSQKLLGDFFLKVKAFRPVIPHVVPGL